MRTPHTTPVISETLGLSRGASSKKVSKSFCWSIWRRNPAGV